MNSSYRRTSLVLGVLSVLLISGSANAYIDAGSGSYLLQILFAGILGAVFTARSVFTNLKLAISRRANPQKQIESKPDAE